MDSKICSSSNEGTVIDSPIRKLQGLYAIWNSACSDKLVRATNHKGVNDGCVLALVKHDVNYGLFQAHYVRSLMWCVQWVKRVTSALALLLPGQDNLQVASQVTNQGRGQLKRASSLDLEPLGDDEHGAIVAVAV
ncbi:hypothetical protein GUJ93_ZPchr0013g38029 [Zizania palustris]|uniref:Uncharacterized protein n=1 Tax=Zizania palustris TaxID=103762 RepID=A0A8J6BW22_ZIZPA|nr:hypothetical protein GUJ93_ZPchr0013g38029 [Zizania palustris]